jgi:hypothetical protein
MPLRPMHGPDQMTTAPYRRKRGRGASGGLAHFQAKPALGLDPGLDPGVETGSPSENATTQREKSEARFYQNGIRFCLPRSCLARRNRQPLDVDGDAATPELDDAAGTPFLKLAVDALPGDADQARKLVLRDLDLRAEVLGERG